MNWQNIKASSDNTHFLINGKLAFNKFFIEVLKFHAPGLAPVKDKSGSYHIDHSGNQLYSFRYTRTFGYYYNRATVILNKKWFHLNEKGERVYTTSFSWAGNFQENLCTVRDKKNNYFHINLNGNRIYSANFKYAGDFKDGVACVKLENGDYKHIDGNGNFINNESYQDLGIFHKHIATAKDKKGWYHIARNGNEIYKQRYLAIEPFYNGFALVTQFDNTKIIINEQGEKIINISNF